MALHLRATANAVASVNFDQRPLDTMGEEFIFFTSVIGCAVLLRKLRDEEEQSGGESRGPVDVFDALRLAGYVLLPLTLLVGAYLVAHGHLSPGGGFQGGVVLATAIHVLYLAGDYPALRRWRSVPAVEVAESIGAGAFVCFGLAGLIVAGSFLTNVLPLGTLRSLVSSGTVLPLNVSVGLEIASGTIVVLAAFLEQALVIRGGGDDKGGGT